MKPGPKPRPALQVVREGNVNKKPVPESAVFNPSDLNEPDWAGWFPTNRVASRRARETAHATWAKLAPVLGAVIGLVGEQQEILVDYCVTLARIEQGERSLSTDGVMVKSERGWVKNPWTTVLAQYRSHLRSLVGELGLSPSAATRIPPGSSQEPETDDPFDQGIDAG